MLRLCVGVTLLLHGVQVWGHAQDHDRYCSSIVDCKPLAKRNTDQPASIGHCSSSPKTMLVNIVLTQQYVDKHNLR